MGRQRIRVAQHGVSRGSERDHFTSNCNGSKDEIAHHWKCGMDEPCTVVEQIYRKTKEGEVKMK